MSTWYLEIAGQKKPLPSWGVTSASLSINSQMTDELKFSCDVSLILSFETKVVLWFDSERRFTGHVTRSQYIGTAGSDRRQYVVSGPWWQLEQIVYQQPRWVLIDAFDPAKGYTNVVTSMGVLFLDTVNGGSIYAGAQAKAAIDYAIAKGAQIARTPTFDLDVAVPWEKSMDLSCAEIVRRCGRWSRDVAMWWDYSPAVPVMHVGRRANLTPVIFDLSAGNAVLEFNPEPRYDLQARGVLLWFLVTEVNADGERWLNPISQGAGSVDGGRRVVVATIKLGGEGKTSEPIPDGLALAYYNSVKDLQWEGSLVATVQGGSGAFGPGHVVNLQNGDSDWATMAALVQTAEEDLFTGNVRIAFGPPTQLGLQDFTELLSAQRGESNTGGSGGNGSSSLDGTPNGMPPPPNGPGGPSSGPTGPTPPSGPPTGGNNGWMKIRVCDDGKPVDININASPA